MRKPKMKNILTHRNDGDPIYIALSDEPAFHVIYQGKSMGPYQSMRSVVEGASSDCISSGTRSIMGWQAFDP